MNKKGFTLVELLAVVAIIAIIGALAVPNVIKMVENSKKEEILTDAKLMISKAKYKYRTSPSFTYKASQLIDITEKGYNDSLSGVRIDSSTGTIIYYVKLNNGKCNINEIGETNLTKAAVTCD